ncbi:MAG: Uma2 family endonuclease [Cyanobacteriota bacterium]|nr:Uma2 family endonuclease [Cyanobacteriota bacterium]
MSVAKDLANSHHQYDTLYPPGDFYSDEPELESDRHLLQIFILLMSLKWLWQDRNDFYATGNMSVYYSPDRTKARDFRGPDFFVVLDTDAKLRKSWVVWEEGGKYPNAIVEILSDSTAEVDRTDKKTLYQNTFKTPDYFWFDPYSFEFCGFTLVDGEYQAIEPTSQGWLWSAQLQLYLGIHQEELRYFTPSGELVPTPEEAAASERQQRQLAQLQLQQLQERLRDMGIDLD